MKEGNKKINERNKEERTIREGKSKMVKSEGIG